MWIIDASKVLLFTIVLKRRLPLVPVGVLVFPATLGWAIEFAYPVDNTIPLLQLKQGVEFKKYAIEYGDPW